MPMRIIPPAMPRIPEMKAVPSAEAARITVTRIGMKGLPLLEVVVEGVEIVLREASGRRGELHPPSR
jgi:hypothetical protein